MAIDPGAGAGPDQHHGTERREQRPPAGKRAPRRDRREAGREETRAEPRLQMGRPGRRAVRDAGAQCQCRERRATTELPEARQRRIEVGDGIGADQPHVPRERRGDQSQRAGENVRAQPPRRPQDQRPDDVELLLDPERPQVEQRLRLGCGIEVTALVPGHEVADEARAGGDVLAERFVLVREQGEPADDERRADHQQQRRKDAANPATIEVGERESAGFEASHQDGGDEEAGNDEEEIDADEAAAKRRRKGVIAHDRQHRHGPQSVDVRSIRRVRRGGGAIGFDGRPRARGPRGRSHEVGRRRVNHDS